MGKFYMFSAFTRTANMPMILSLSHLPHCPQKCSEADAIPFHTKHYLATLTAANIVTFCDSLHDFAGRNQARLTILSLYC